MPNPVSANLSFTVMSAPQGDPAGIDGTFNPANEVLTLPGNQAYTADRNATYTAYVLTTP